MQRVEYYHQPDAPVANSIRVAVTAFVQDTNGAVLAIRRRDNDLLALPGGLQEIGETLSHSVVREVKEETGINVEVTGLIGVFSDPEYVISYPDGTVAQEFTVCFRARPYSGQPRPSTESSAVHWIPPENLADPQIATHVSPGALVCIRQETDGGPEPYFT